MKKFQFKKPDMKGGLQKLKNLKLEDVKAYRKMRLERQLQKKEEWKASKWGIRTYKAFQVMNRFSLVFHALLALFINFAVEAMSRHSIFAAWDYMTGTPLVFLYNAFMIFMTFSIVYLVKRRIFVRTFLTILWLVIGLTNGVILSNRVTPFNAQDLKNVTEAVAILNNYFNLFEIVVIAILSVILVLWVVNLWKTAGKYEGKSNKIVAVILIVATIGGYTWFTDWAITNRVVSTYFGNIAFAYEDYGLPYCFAASLFNTGISQPNGYTEEKMDEINSKDMLTNVSTELEEFPNVVFVQLESFFDTTEFEALQTSEDPLPYLRSLFEEYSSGYFKVPSVGAGTANTEFEVLTGMNLRYFGPGEYPYKTYLKERTAESAATAYAALGYGTHALHNNGGNFYSRANVFSNIGFDSYTCKEFMNILQLTENGWAKDDILLTHIEDCLNSTEQQDFIFAITVQGHGAYPEEKVIENPRITATGLETEAKNNQWEYYVNQVYEMDIFCKNLVELMESREEPAVIVFYGDHLPTMGLEARDMKSRYLYNTNYVIWDNIGLEKEDRNVPTYQIMADVMERLDIHSGTIFNYHQQRRQTDDYLSDLELLQYDILYGGQFVYDGEPVITEGHMQMGIRDAYVHELVENFNGTYSLYGENFTKWSKVYINGEKQSSKFLNNTRIELKESVLENGDILVVSQVGSKNTIFRSSAEYVFYDGILMENTAENQLLIESAQSTESSPQ